MLREKTQGEMQNTFQKGDVVRVMASGTILSGFDLKKFQDYYKIHFNNSDMPDIIVHKDMLAKLRSDKK